MIDTDLNPLLEPWDGPFGGVPAFDRVVVADFGPALEAGMQAQLAEIDAIAGDPVPPTFDNTIAAMERSGRRLRRALTYYDVWSSTMRTPELADVEVQMEPRLAAFGDQILQNAALFARVDAVLDGEGDQLSDEQRRVTEEVRKDFVLAGAKLDSADKARVSEINQELAGLFTRFSQNLVADEDTGMVVLDEEADLAGLPAAFIDAAAAAAEERGRPGTWVIANTRSSVEPFLTYSNRRDLREQVWRMFILRGDGDGDTDNKSLIPQIVDLRHERARLLGFDTHADYRLAKTMAKTPERTFELMNAVWKPAVDRVAEEVAAMQAIADRLGDGITIEPWDYRYYAEKVRQERYDLDQSEIEPYLQLDKLREGMFWVAGRLFDLAFTPVEDVPVCHPDVKVWAVSRSESGRHVGVWYFDPFARLGKRSGAWMSQYREQERFDGEITTIVSNNSNFVKGKPGEPVLISWRDATTLFHEFGHALHGLSSDVTYPYLSGTRVARDYVEFPSQLLEHWLATPEVLSRFALHHETGEPLPIELLERIERAATFNEGFATTEYLSCALLDMMMHTSTEPIEDVAAFERNTLEELGMPAEIVMRHRLPQFFHGFSGDSYSAGYYSYLWSDTLTADAYEAFTEAGGPYDEEVAGRMHDHIFAVGNTVDPADGYRAFRGRDPDIGALMRKRGFVGS